MNCNTMYKTILGATIEIINDGIVETDVNAAQMPVVCISTIINEIKIIDHIIINSIWIIWDNSIF
ncbi:hypothetical protein [Mycoplasmopsis cynos]|uniref:Uncharacterized protein n=2 Tax=Mycoplasmopsis cynos TaxID=171284 RepID=L0RUC7_MYCC1|nr:hypothetical protein [Mycoplasmopsis cynos]MCU9935020.1 hypothetical protein [Mycoplasmopsis cynos]WAM05475.1 hypothetical protein OM999_03870 [Mycoplasmopsis cynos]CCP23879.1 Hypothetical protein MCYN_0147 [Mycoplasmopsis cynos C142]